MSIDNRVRAHIIVSDEQVRLRSEVRQHAGDLNGDVAGADDNRLAATVSDSPGLFQPLSSGENERLLTMHHTFSLDVIVGSRSSRYSTSDLFRAFHSGPTPHPGSSSNSKKPSESVPSDAPGI